MSGQNILEDDERIWRTAYAQLNLPLALIGPGGVIALCTRSWTAHANTYAAGDPDWMVGGNFLTALAATRYSPGANRDATAAYRGALEGAEQVHSIAFERGDSTPPLRYSLSFRRFCTDERVCVLVRLEYAVLVADGPARCESEVMDGLRALAAEHMDRAVMILDLGGQIEWVNPGFTRLMGYVLPEILGKTPEFLNGPRTQPAAQDLIARSLREGSEVDVEVLHYTKAGLPIWTRAHIRPIRNAAGTLEHFVALEVDITERKRATDRKAAEHELLSAIVNGVPHQIIWKDRNLVIRGCNLNYARMAGLDSPNEIIGRTVEELPLIAPHADRYNKLDREILATGKPALRLRETLRMADGEERVVMMNRMPLRFKDELVTGILVINEDVTDEERAAQKRREDDERWNLALELNTGIWDINLEANTVVGSQRWLEMLPDRGDWRLSYAPLPAELVYKDDLPQLLADWDALLNGTMPALTSALRLRIGGEYRHVRLRGRVVKRTSSGKTVRVVGTLADVHDAVLKQIQTHMQLANASKLESIGELAAGIAHEINTPAQYVGDNVRFLADSFDSILGCIDGINALAAACMESALSQGVFRKLASADMPYLSKEIPKAISQSLEGIERIAKIVGAMKEFSHPGQDRAPTDINHAIANTITVATNEWKYVATITTDFDSSLPLVPVVPGEFNQVILNIIVNAAHAIGEARVANGAHMGTIRVTTKHLTQWAEIRISDDGCGMPAHVQEKIFDPFFTTKPVGKGTGQGLAIAHNIVVKKHGGTILVTSEPGSGTAFTIRMPLSMEKLGEAAA
jgi:PAS domain S-box-containing protein